MKHAHHPSILASFLLLLLWWVRPVQTQGTTTFFDRQELLEELDEAIDLWLSKNVTHYRFTSQTECFCPSKYTQPLTVEVKDSNIVDVSDASGDRITDNQVRNAARDVERLFTRIEAALWQNPQTMRVQYNQLYGYPMSIHVEYSSMNADDDWDTQITGFAPFSKWENDLKEAKREWISHDLEHYEYGYHRQCDDCAPQFTEPMRIHVEDGIVREAYYQVQHIPVLQTVVAPTIDEVFEELEDALQQLPHEWMVTFHERYGYPTYAFVDFDKMKRDDEIIIRCREMVPLGALEAELEENEELWNSYGIVSYTYSFRRGCLGTLCSTDVGVELAKTHVIEVADHEVVRVDGIFLNGTTTSSGGEDTDVQRQRSSDVIFTASTFPTIPDLFEEIEDGLKNEAYRVDTTYDEEYGYPIRIWIDEIAGTSFDSSFSATTKLLSIEKQVTRVSGATKRGVDIASLELFPTVVTFVLLTTILL